MLPHFPFLFFYSITLFYITFIAVLTTAMSTLMPKIFPLCVYTVHMYCAQGPDQFSVHSLYSTVRPIGCDYVRGSDQSEADKNETLRTPLHTYIPTSLHPYIGTCEDFNIRFEVLVFKFSRKSCIPDLTALSWWRIVFPPKHKNSIYIQYTF